MDRASIAALAILSLCWSATPKTALADISSDLRFCGGLKSSKERLACYDAAARIVSMPQRQPKLTTAPLESPKASVGSVERVPRQSKFNGLYAAVTGGYDVPTAPQNNTGFARQTEPSAIKGSKIGATVGYNVTSDRLLLGIEARAQYAVGSDIGGYSYISGSPSLPKLIGGCTGCIPGNYQSPYPTTLVSAMAYEERISRPWSADFSARAGIIFDDWLLYGRSGLGIEYSRLVITRDQSKSISCINPTFSFVPSAGGAWALDHLLTACTSLQGGLSTTEVAAKLTPIITLAAGVEQNFGDLFVRAEAELLVHFPSVLDQIYYSPSVNVAFGYRF